MDHQLANEEYSCRKLYHPITPITIVTIFLKLIQKSKNKI